MREAVSGSCGLVGTPTLSLVWELSELKQKVMEREKERENENAEREREREREGGRE